MPRGDRTGPSGFGSMTGRGAGYCSGNNTPGFANFAGGSGGAGYGRGAGFRGSGRGWQNRFNAQGGPYGVRYGQRFSQGDRFNTPAQNPYMQNEITPEQEIEMLKGEANHIQGDLKAINDRIGELENIADKKV